MPNNLTNVKGFRFTRSHYDRYLKLEKGQRLDFIDQLLSKQFRKVERGGLFETDVERCYMICLECFPVYLQPQTQTQTNQWMDTIKKLNEIDNIPFEVIEQIVCYIRNDEFWGKNFLSLNKLRKKNRDQVPYITVFWEAFKSSKEYKSLERLSEVEQKYKEREL